MPDETIDARGPVTKVDLCSEMAVARGSTWAPSQLADRERGAKERLQMSCFAHSNEAKSGAEQQSSAPSLCWQTIAHLLATTDSQHAHLCAAYPLSPEDGRPDFVTKRRISIQLQSFQLEARSLSVPDAINWRAGRHSDVAPPARRSKSEPIPLTPFWPIDCRNRTSRL